MTPIRVFHVEQCVAKRKSLWRSSADRQFMLSISANRERSPRIKGKNTTHSRHRNVELWKRQDLSKSGTTRIWHQLRAGTESEEPLQRFWNGLGIRPRPTGQSAYFIEIPAAKPKKSMFCSHLG
jgi:hypothetical protein